MLPLITPTGCLTDNVRIPADTDEPTQNGLAERFMRTLKEELVDYSNWQTYDEARRQILTFTTNPGR